MGGVPLTWRFCCQKLAAPVVGAVSGPMAVVTPSPTILFGEESSVQKAEGRHDSSGDDGSFCTFN